MKCRKNELDLGWTDKYLQGEHLPQNALSKFVRDFDPNFRRWVRRIGLAAVSSPLGFMISDLGKNFFHVLSIQLKIVSLPSNYLRGGEKPALSPSPIGTRIPA